MKEKQAWYIFYTHPRSEKRVSETLISYGYEIYLPLKQEIHYWKNRQKKQISTPLFPNYIFVQTYRSYIYNVLQLPKIVRCISCNSTPSTISSKKIDLIKKMLLSNVDLALENEKLSGRNARIIHGPFQGMEGILYNKNGSNRFLIQINDSPFNLSIEVETKDLRIIAKD